MTAAAIGKPAISNMSSSHTSIFPASPHSLSRELKREHATRKPRGIMAVAVCVLLFPVWFTAWALAVAVAAQFDRTREWARWLREAGRRYRYGGFTLIELSIVLVIIGLIVGGVLVGQNLINAAALRAQVSQIEQYNAAANTFYGKYGALPGDLQPALASRFGFNPTNRAGTQGRGDGNGLIDGYMGVVVSNPSSILGGETAMFWGDLTSANLINANLSIDQSDSFVDNGNAGSLPVSSVLPAAKIGNNNYIIVYSSTYGNTDYNYFGILSVISITYGAEYNSTSYYGNGLTVQQAYAMDKKIDDGLPTSGNVIVGAPVNIGYLIGVPGGSATSCFDSTAGTYSITQNNGNGVNCTLSFRMQAGD